MANETPKQPAKPAVKSAEEPKPTTDMHGAPLEAGSVVQVAARVTKAEDGKIDIEIVDPDPEAKPITASGLVSTLTKATDINPRIGACPQIQGPGIREVLAKEGGIKPVASSQEDDESTADLPHLTALKASTLTPAKAAA